MSINVFGVSGKARAGKDTLFAVAQEDGFEKLSFAGELKRRARFDFDLTDEHTDGKLKEIVTDSLNGHSPREFLIDLGNLYRKYCPTFWVDIVLKTIITNPDKKYMITDVRYPNEADALREVGGMILRLERHPDRDSMVDEKTKLSISETALDNYQNFNFVLKGEDNRVPEDLRNFWSMVKSSQPVERV
jgi:hypothetical protein